MAGNGLWDVFKPGADSYLDTLRSQRHSLMFIFGIFVLSFLLMLLPLDKIRLKLGRIK